MRISIKPIDRRGSPGPGWGPITVIELQLTDDEGGKAFYAENVPADLSKSAAFSLEHAVQKLLDNTGCITDKEYRRRIAVLERSIESAHDRAQEEKSRADALQAQNRELNSRIDKYGLRAIIELAIGAERTADSVEMLRQKVKSLDDAVSARARER